MIIILDLAAALGRMERRANEQEVGRPDCDVGLMEWEAAAEPCPQGQLLTSLGTPQRIYSNAWCLLRCLLVLSKHNVILS